MASIGNVPEVNGTETDTSKLLAKDSGKLSSSSESNLSGSTANSDILEKSESSEGSKAPLKVVNAKDLVNSASNALGDLQDDASLQQSTKSKGDKSMEAEDGDDESSDSESSSGGIFDRSYYGERASRLSSKALYKAYSTKLKNADNKRKKTPKPPKAPKLVKGLVDYLRVLEDRLEKLESRLPDDEKPDTKADDSKKEEASDEGFTVKTMFYDCANEGSVDFVDLSQDDRWKEHSTFTSEVDPKHMLRVLYKWKNNSTDLGDGDIPSADHIEILAIRILSEPVAKFFEDIAKCEIDRYNLVLMRKPFRFLVRGASKIRQQLAKLEAQHSFLAAADQLPYGECNRDPDTHPDTHGKVLEEGPRLAESIAPEKDDAKSVAPYDTQEALHHFKELVSFIDTYLSQELQLYEDLRSQVRGTVAFENLWMLFDYQDIIYCPSKKGGQTFRHGIGDDEMATSRRRDVPQAYRVLGTSGGVPLTGQVLPAVEKKAVSTIAAHLLQARQNASSGEDQLSSQQSAPRAKDRYSALYISCYYLDFDGTNLKTAADFIVIKPYEGDIDINSLEVRPLKYPSQQSPQHPIVEELAKRGRKFLEYTSITHLSYDGVTVGDSREEINSPVIIDFKEAFQVNSSLVPSDADDQLFWSRFGLSVTQEMPRSCSDQSCHAQGCWDDRYIPHQKAQSFKTTSELNTLLEEHDLDGTESRMIGLRQELERQDLLILLPGVVYGFALRNRRWLEFDIRRLEQVQTDDNESGWNDLVLPSDHRRMVQSMVETHSAVTRTTIPAKKGKNEIGLVQGKGKGCIILLHGVPGVGKTSTAECVAAYTRRPLFPITCGDIGYEPETLEKKLEDLFKLAHKWGCVLLIDEADVFLAERDKANVKRNGLVSVFLRILEYYSGILFLTTNRVGAFDDAFRSRIHLTLYYPKLDEKQSYEIWKTNIKRLKRMNESRAKEGLPKIRIDRDKILNFAELNYKTLQWNGRQIQNAFHTALALAQFEVRATQIKGPEITKKHFEIIANAAIQFDTYLKEVHRTDESTKAKNSMVRADNAELETPRKIILPITPELSSESSTEESSSDSERRRKKKKKAKSKRRPKKDVEEDQDEEEGTKPSKSKKTKKKTLSSDSELDSTPMDEKVKKSTKKARKGKREMPSSDDDYSE